MLTQLRNFIAPITALAQPIVLFTAILLPISSLAAPDPNFHIYLLFGQSNMEGVGTIETQDKLINPRVKVMSDLDCSNLGRNYGNWYLASPPLNRCWGGLGPGDYFGKTMADGMSSQITIGLVPVSVSGIAIEFYQKSAPLGRNNTDFPTQFNSGYAWLLDMAKKAQEVGVIKGIIFHQGETNTANQEWKFKVKEIVTDLRADLGIGDVPFLAGELLYADYGSCCHWHNPEVNKLPGLINNSFVISAMGLAGTDEAHFTSASYRELGKRYATVMLEKIDRNDNIPGSSTASSAITSATSSTPATAASSAAKSSVATAINSSSANATKSSSGGGAMHWLWIMLLALFACGRNHSANSKKLR